MKLKFLFRRNLKPQNDIFISGRGQTIGPNFNQARRLAWTEESFYKDAEAPSLSKNIKPKIVFFIGAILLCALSVLLARTFFLQILQGDEYYALASKNSIREIRLVAERGLIYDREGRQLVRNIPTYTLLLDPQELSSKISTQKEKIEQIAGALEVPPEEVFQNIEKFKKFSGAAIPIKTNLTHQEALRLDVELGDAAGVRVAVDSERDYLESKSTPSLSHLLGYVGKISALEIAEHQDYSPQDSIGKTGIERAYQEVLHGSSGRRQIQVDALGREKLAINLAEPSRGADIKLTIDLDLQAAAERILRNHLASRGKRRGAVIALDPKNGEILTLVSWPAFDNNDFSGGISKNLYESLINDPNKPLFFRAISGEYPSGSTIKPFLVAAALQEGIINEQTTFLSIGGIKISKWFFPDWKVGGHGRVDLFRAIAESVNTFFYYIGGGYLDFQGLGPDKMAEYLRLFGFGGTLAIDLPGEARGLLPTPEWKKNARSEDWYIGDTYHAAIGQGDILVTPLQLTAAIGAIVNGGTLWRPHLKIGEATVLGTNIINPAHLALVRRAMRQTITSGSATRLNDLAFGVAGKTGTAEWRKGASAHAWFTGFAPWTDPEIVVTVLIEEGGEGSQAAVPVAREIFEHYFTYKRDSKNTNSRE